MARRNREALSVVDRSGEIAETVKSLAPFMM